MNESNETHVQELSAEELEFGEKYWERAPPDEPDETTGLPSAAQVGDAVAEAIANRMRKGIITFLIGFPVALIALTFQKCLR